MSLLHKLAIVLNLSAAIGMVGVVYKLDQQDKQRLAVEEGLLALRIEEAEEQRAWKERFEVNKEMQVKEMRY